MPNVDKEAIKTLCVAVGIREGARQLGLSEERVLKWSQRGKWLKQPDPVPIPPTMKHDVLTVRKPSDVMANMGKNTKFHLSKAAEKAAIKLSEMSPDVVIDKAQQFRHIVAGSSTLHQWESAPIQVGTLNMGILTNQAAVQVVSPRE